mmetsp:Transcript_21128/g.65199  ORF Transcript_21128/g.65199 Transcript_21128/m.65199 type:complete len:271 (+) Transcript_21128:641-1453(+)
MLAKIGVHGLVRPVDQVLPQCESAAVQPRRALRAADFHVDGRHEHGRSRRDGQEVDQPRQERDERYQAAPGRLHLRAALSVSSQSPRLRARAPSRRHVVVRQFLRDAHDPRFASGLDAAAKVALLRALQLLRNPLLPRPAVVQQPVPHLHRLRRGLRLERPAGPARQAPRLRAPHVARHRALPPPQPPHLLGRPRLHRPLLRHLVPLLRLPRPPHDPRRARRPRTPSSRPVPGRRLPRRPHRRSSSHHRPRPRRRRALVVSSSPLCEGDL